MSPSPGDIPTPDDLDLGPELFVLAALDTTLQAAVHEVVAQQPALRGPDHAEYHERDDSHWVAQVLVNLATPATRRGPGLPESPCSRT